MNRMIIIDDRKERKKTFLSSAEIVELEKYEKHGCLTMLTDLNEDNYEQELSSYRIIAIHQSLMKTKNLVNRIEDFASRSRKYLIIFSGGITQNLLLKNRTMLIVNATDFYAGRRLLTFVKKNSENELNHPLLEFIYGEHWRLTILMEYRNLLWRGGEDADFEKESQLRELLDENAMNQFSMDWLDKEISKERINFTLL